MNQAIQTQKGKIVVVDVWATFCAPCRKEFPHFLDIHRKQTADGVACISVSIDDEGDHEKALTFLKQQQADTSNFRVDAPHCKTTGSFPGSLSFASIRAMASSRNSFPTPIPISSLSLYADIEALVSNLKWKSAE